MARDRTVRADRAPATRTQSGPPEARDAGERKTRSERWNELLDAAAQIFFEKGYDGTSLQDIADRVGILKGSIYYYINTKADLRDHLVLQVHEGGIAMIRSLADTPGNAIEKLEAMIAGHIMYVCNNLPHTTVYLQQFKNVLADPDRKIDQHEYRAVFETVMREGQESGMLLADLEPSFTAQAMMGALNSLYNWYRPSRSRPARVIAEHFARVMVRGHASEEGIVYLTKRGG